MITIEQAKRATELAEQRERIIKQANRLRVEGARLTVECDRPWHGEPAAKLEFSVLADRLQKLIGEEARAQVAAIDAELRALGVEPDAFEAAAPEAPAPEPVTTRTHVTVTKPETRTVQCRAVVVSAKDKAAQDLLAAATQRLHEGEQTRRKGSR